MRGWSNCVTVRARGRRPSASADVSRLTNRHCATRCIGSSRTLLALCAAADAPWFWTLWEQAPTVAAQRRLSSEALGAILAARRIPAGDGG